MLLDRHRVVGAALHGGVVGDHHALDALHPADPGDHPGGARALFDGNRSLDHAADNLRRTMGEALIEGNGGTLTLTGDGAVLLRGFVV